MNKLSPDTLQADGAQIDQFVASLFKHADEGSFISLRVFDQFERGRPPVVIEGVAISGDMRAAMTAATRIANKAAGYSSSVVFCPPVATFKTAHSAKTADLANGVALSVDIDSGDTTAALKQLQHLIGPVTIASESGGEWSDPDNGEVHKKMHLHWRLSEPTRTAEDHRQLQHARWLAAMLVGADTSGAPSAHPLRWPGSVHTKATPRLSQITIGNDGAEIHLHEAIEKLEDAVEAAGLGKPTKKSMHTSGTAQASNELIASAVPYINNTNVSWDQWVRIGMAVFSATGGSDEGREIWVDWSAKSEKHEEAACNERWVHFGHSKPSRIGAGTLFYLAKAAGWERPQPVNDRNEPVGFMDDAGMDNESVTSNHHPAVSAPLSFRDETSARIWTDPTALHGLHVPERQWIVQDWLPCGHVTLNYGDGGTGKTLAAQQLMTSTALGKPWLGLAVERCKSFGFFAEDDEDELHRRQAAICDAYGSSFYDLGDMRWTSGVGRDNLLVTFDHDGRAQLTPLFAEIREEAKRFGARFVVIDTAADTFGGNENDRSQVRQFIGRALNDLAQYIGGAVLLNAHPSRSGMSASGDGDGGSTGWSNSARSRWSLTRRGADEDGPGDTDARILSRRKANYASIGENINLRWERGVLVSTSQKSDRHSSVTDHAACEKLFLTLLARCEKSNYPLSSSKNASNFAPKAFAKRPDAEGFRWKDFDLAMSALMASGQIAMELYGRRGDQRRKIVQTVPDTEYEEV